MAITVALTSRAANEIVISLTLSAGGTILAELNRSADFASDDSLFKSIGTLSSGTSSQTIRGLPSGTAWYLRILSSTGETSATLYVATTEVALVSSYSGFSVDKSLLVEPVGVMSLAGGYAANNAQLAGFPPSNLLRDDPQSTWQVLPSAGVGLSASLVFETSGAPIDTVALLGTLANDDMLWTVESAPTAGGFAGAGSTTSNAVSFRCSPTVGARAYYHALYTLPAATTNRFWRISINSTTTHSVSFLARQLVLGLALQSVNPSRGATESLNDTGSFSRGRFGTPDRVAGWRGRSVDFELSWLRENEYQTKWSPLLTRVGRTKPVLALANGKRNIWTNDRLAYGAITDIRGENVQSSRHAVAISIDSLY